MIAASATATCRLYGRRYSQQPPHQPRVVRLAEDFFFVEGHDFRYGSSFRLPATGCQLDAASTLWLQLSAQHSGWKPGNCEPGSWKL